MSIDDALAVWRYRCPSLHEGSSRSEFNAAAASLARSRAGRIGQAGTAGDHDRGAHRARGALPAARGRGGDARQGLVHQLRAIFSRVTAPATRGRARRSSSTPGRSPSCNRARQGDHRLLLEVALDGGPPIVGDGEVAVFEVDVLCARRACVVMDRALSELTVEDRIDISRARPICAGQPGSTFLVGVASWLLMMIQSLILGTCGRGARVSRC